LKRIEGKIALVTGSARGIGRAVVERFAAEGAKMVISCDVVDTTYPESNVKHILLNVTDREDIKLKIKQVVEEFGRIDILINNAGITKDGPFVRMSEEQWDAVINVNLKGVFNVTQAVAPHMSRQKSGAIVTLSSIAGLMGNIGQTNYSATKGGVISMSKTWAKELARKGAQIRVNCVAPGFIQTSMTHDLPEKVIEGMLERIPLKRMGTVEDVVNAILFLASDESSFITGETIAVTGGMVI
jgi:3-oxoacyl-[acyl-carrier protein] reductase